MKNHTTTNYKFLNAEDMKTVLMMWFRFIKQAILVATEAGRHSADVLIVDEDNKLIEIEIKVSLLDFKNDFRKGKHLMYEEARRTSFCPRFHFQPHYFYFAVPENLLPSIKPLLIGKPYGLIAFRDVGYNLNLGDIKEAQAFRIVKEPKRMRFAPITSDELFELYKRVSSDLIRTRIRARGKRYVDAY